jgi:hypothetical protein
VVYADAAAESQSEWSMLSASQCHEALGDWRKAEEYKRAISNHYPASAMEWMLWCYRTGHGDTDAADACARAHFESLGTSFRLQTRQKIGVYYLLRKELDKALVVFNKTFEESHDPTTPCTPPSLPTRLAKRTSVTDCSPRSPKPASTRQTQRPGFITSWSSN